MSAIELLREMSGRGKTQQQKYVSLLLEQKGVTADSLLTDLVDIAQNASKTTPIGDIIEDYKTRLSALKLLLELSGDYTPAKQNVSVNLGLANMFYGHGKKEDDGGIVIQADQVSQEGSGVH